MSPSISDKKLFDLIYKDDLTGVYNRRFYNRTFPEMAKKSKENNTPLSYLMMDIDHFKSFNDSYGHKVGDKVLSKIAKAIEENAGEDAITIRYAGDEFVVLMPQVEKGKAKEKAESIKRSVGNKDIILDDNAFGRIRATLSIGLANFPEDTYDPFQLPDLADKALYISKRKGRNRVSTVDEEPLDTLDLRTLYRYFPARRMVGRDNILSEVSPLLSPSYKGSRKIIVFSGLPGVGKTRLLEELYRRCDPTRTFPIKTRGTAFTVGQPFAEIIEPLESILEKNQDLATEVISNINQKLIKAVVPFIPMLGRYVVPEGEAAALIPNRDTVLEALKQIIIEVSKLKPIFIFFDEFQYANLGTRLLLGSLKENNHSHNIGIFLSISDVELVKKENLDLISFFRKYEKRGLLKRIYLKKLTYDEVALMVDAIIPGLKKFHHLIDFLYKYSDGNPKKVENLMKTLVLKGFISLKGGKLVVAEKLDPSLLAKFFEKGTIRIDLDNIAPEDVKRLLSKAAVMGTQFRLTQLKAVDERSEGYLYDILQKAEQADILRRHTQEEEDVFEFRGRDIKDEFYTKLKEDQRKSLHIRVGEFEKEANKDKIHKVLSQLAYHFKHGGKEEEAIKYIMQMANDFAGLFSPEHVEMYIGYPPPHLTSWSEERHLNAEEEKMALVVLKRLLIAVHNVYQYPSESEIVRGSIESAFKKLSELLDRVKVISFSESDGLVLINNERPVFIDQENIDEEAFVRLLNDINLKEISFRKGFTRCEFERFLSILTSYSLDKIEAEGGWQGVLRRNQIVNALANQKVFVSMSVKDLMDSRRIKIRRNRVKKSLYADKKKKKSTSLTPKELEERLKILKKEYLKDDKLIEFFTKVEQVLALLNTYPVSNIQKDEGKAISKEGDSGKLKVPHLKKSTTYSSVSKENSFEIIVMDKIKTDTDVLIEELTSDNIELVKAAGSALLAKGRVVIDSLVDFICNSDSVLGRKTAITILKKLEKDAYKRLIDALLGNTNARQKERLLKALKEFPHVPVEDISTIFLCDCDLRVRGTFISLFEKEITPERIKILIECLQDKNEDVVSDIAYALARIKATEAIPALIEKAKKRWIFFSEPPIKVQEAVCKALGKLGGEEALKVLVENLTISPFYTLKRNKPPQVRAASAFALGYYPIEKVLPYLEKAEKDPSPIVRSAVKLAKTMASVDEKPPSP